MVFISVVYFSQFEKLQQRLIKGESMRDLNKREFDKLSGETFVNKSFPPSCVSNL